jgi:hypothetical protein
VCWMRYSVTQAAGNKSWHPGCSGQDTRVATGTLSAGNLMQLHVHCIQPTAQVVCSGPVSHCNNFLQSLLHSLGCSQAGE